MSRRGGQDGKDEKESFNYHTYWIPTLHLICSKDKHREKSLSNISAFLENLIVFSQQPLTATINCKPVSFF